MTRLLMLIVAWLLLAGVVVAQELRLYTSVDQPVAAKIIADFEQQTGIKVRMLTDTEATKSAGLAERVRAEANNPRADVWWSNEPFHTIRLANEGLLAPYKSPRHAELPAIFVDSKSRWAGSAVRIRVLIAGAKAAPLLKGYRDMLNPALKNSTYIAKPAFGTTGGHVAALYVLLGEAQYRAYLQDLRANGCRVLGGNAIVANTVAGGENLAGFTDNDDVAAVNAGGAKTTMVIPDQEADGIGTLAVPCTVGLITGSKQAELAGKLIDYLLSKEVEERLIAEKFAYASARAGSAVRYMQVDYNKVAEAMPRAVNLSLEILEQ